MIFDILGITCTYGATPVLQDASLQIHTSDMVGIVGPNGSGKSTLLRAMSRVLQPLHGKVMLEEEDIYKVPATQIAKKMAVVVQEQSLSFPFTVRDLIMMGRIPHMKRFASEGRLDIGIVEQAMDLTDTTRLADRQVNELSGGEKQRVLLARALAQEPKILLLDEPTSYLDLNYQIEIMQLLAKLRRQYGITIIMVLHDLNLASRYCDYLVLIKQGTIHAIGPPQHVITADMIKDVYGCEIKVEQFDLAAPPYILFHNDDHRAVKAVRPDWVHVVGGGGSGGGLLRSLVKAGWNVSIGVVNVADSDWDEANRLGVSIIEAHPFSGLGMEEARRNRDMMNKADFTILAGAAFGMGNLLNLECVIAEAERGGRVVVIDNPAIITRDYTGGEATRLYKQLLDSGAHRVNNEWEAVRMIEGERP
ncbi:MAG: heme ABC transporter ATP-binding protein [Syntrophomonadaceae bacterium]|nr:heme ABC transporter ATP-binding protein [Syntrophomonadaceae bacterium]